MKNRTPIFITTILIVFLAASDFFVYSVWTQNRRIQEKTKQEDELLETLVKRNAEYRRLNTSPAPQSPQIVSTISDEISSSMGQKLVQSSGDTDLESAVQSLAGVINFLSEEPRASVRQEKNKIVLIYSNLNIAGDDPLWHALDILDSKKLIGAVRIHGSIESKEAVESAYKELVSFGIKDIRNEIAGSRGKRQSSDTISIQIRSI